MAIVWVCALSVDAYAAAGKAVEAPRPCCPGCEEAMVFWSGYWRPVRCGSIWHVWVRRARCHGCQVGHALLPSFLLVKRLDCVEVVGEAIAAIADGAGTTSAAGCVGVPPTTARSWWRRHRQRARLAVAVLTALGCAVGGVAPAVVVLSALEACGAGTSEASRPACWRWVSLHCGGAWLAPLHHHHHHHLASSRNDEGGVPLL
jgi:hypothetical protein